MSATDKSSSRKESPIVHLWAAKSRLGSLARQAKTQPICWIGNGGDAGSDYCRRCCEAEVQKIRAADPDSEALVDGGGEDHRPADGSSHCEGCGTLLSYSLTESGLEEELAHFVHLGAAAFKAPLSPEDAFAVQEILEAAEDDGRPEIISQAAAIGMAAAVCLSSHQEGAST